MIFARKLIWLFLVINLVAFALSFFKKNDLPDKNLILDSLYQEPIQKETNLEPFTKESGGVLYNITPRFDYELYGLIVSYHHSDSWFDYYHEMADDFLNTKDVCVIWGENIGSEVYKEMKFKSGSWTCYPEFKTGTVQAVWSKFRKDSISNNHLIPDNAGISKKIMQAETGDQFYLKGYLVDYSNDQNYKRTTSVIRDDYDCEVIYVTDFQILGRVNHFWHLVYSFSKASIIICLLILLLFFFFTPVAASR